ncbi:hypothetical protein GH741_15280 [Aquibacillus halophilus]|uniref:Uncharacterized protein n=1 Tax=Aquibacillus halophilus TaxID=930132 RepID=A0A6A8DEK7_9BACI|nr:hypothetical protein [Aquibacillus halophilus]MRH44004.1 hypothetical protein [Aquibacillus halophilus]
MNKATIESINEMVFMNRNNLFEKPDVILYHPGHFPELNEQLSEYYKNFGANIIIIPEVFNSFLNCSEYEFYVPLLIKEGIEKEKLIPIQNNDEIKGVDGVIQSAFSFINKTSHQNILLAGKSFFCKRFYFLATFYANRDKVLDVLPLQDSRDITPSKWINSEKGRVRVLNEIEQYAKIAKEKLYY